MIYLGSCMVIYLVEKHPIYYTPLDNLFRQNLSEGFVISPLVILECLVYPFKQNDAVLQERFEQFFQTVTVLSLDEEVFRKAGLQRAKFSTKTPDALHLATAEHYDCTQLWTNDDRLKSVSSLVVNVLSGIR
jgi:uncharacterized protein